MQRWALAVTAILMIVANTHAHAVTIDWVTVGDAGNAADTTGYGAVADAYRIGKYEVTIQHYTDFLNAVATTDPYSLYNTRMASDPNIAGISRAGSSGGYSYSVINNGGLLSGNRPITYVSWFDAARFANWMHNGQGAGTTETGAYTLNGVVGGTAPARNVDARFWIPTENEWYKAAYYKGSGTNAGYWDYATQSDSAPGNTIGSGANQANYRLNGTTYSVTQSASYSSSQNFLTDVGAFSGSVSAYGTFDQSGNVWEWNDFTGVAGSPRGLRGGYWNNEASQLSSSASPTRDPSLEGSDVGFRLAAVPEPSTGLLVVLGLGGLLLKRRKTGTL